MLSVVSASSQETKMHRRQMIQAAASLLGAAMLPSCGDDAAKSPVAQKIIVIGSGIAGLAAARSMVQAGHDVTVLEAQDRIGGRLKTDATTLSAPVDLGASWIHGIDSNPIKALADEINAVTAVTSYDSSILYDSDGQEISVARQLKLTALDAEFHNAIKAAQTKAVDQSLYSAIWDGMNAAALPADEQQLIKFLISSQLETEYGGAAVNANSASVGDLSTLWFDNSKQFGGDDVVFAQGYGVIVDYLKTGLTIKTSEKVTAIDYSEATVIVSTANGDYTADKVLVTVPLGVLKKGTITFTPPLPTAHTDAIEQIGMGVLDKLYFEFDSTFWANQWGTTKYDWIESIPSVGTSQTWTEWVCLDKAIGKLIWVGFCAADAAVALEKMTDAEIEADAMTRLQSIFGNAIPKPIKVLRTKWWSDPYTYGSYSFNKVGMNETARIDLAKSVDGRLFFAGEATNDDHFGTVHGAYLSGLRAADEMKV
jgi:monoamine oxidase